MGAIKDIAIRVGDRLRQVQVPQGWNDLDQRTLLLCWNAMFGPEGRPKPVAPANLVLMQIATYIMRMGKKEMEYWKADCMAAYDKPEIGELAFFQELQSVVSACLDGLFSSDVDESGNTTFSPRLNLTKCPYPILVEKAKTGSKRRATYYYAPDDGLENMTLYEMAYTFAQWEAYQSTGNEVYAHRVIAALWRPSRPYIKSDPHWEGDRRQPLRGAEKRLEERTKLAASLPLLVRRVIIFWFASCHAEIMAQYPRVFRPAEGESGGNWGELLLAVAGGPAHLETVSDQHYSNALTWLSMKDQEAEKLERRTH